MKKTFTLLLIIFICSFSWCQTPIDTNGGNSDWLFMNSDMAVQVRYRQIKQENDIAYFEVQFRINFDDPIFCKNSNCLGYLFEFSYPTLDNEHNTSISYKFYNTFKGIYTFPQQIPIKMVFSDGSKRFLSRDGFFYNTAAEPSKIYPAHIFLNCVDIISLNNPGNHRCKPYKSEFKDLEAIVLK